MLEPYEQEEARQRAWDILIERYPHCTKCGNSVYPGEIYFEMDDIILCENCLDKYTHDITELEEW